MAKKRTIQQGSKHKSLRRQEREREEKALAKRLARKKNLLLRQGTSPAAPRAVFSASRQFRGVSFRTPLRSCCMHTCGENGGKIAPFPPETCTDAIFGHRCWTSAARSRRAAALPRTRPRFRAICAPKMHLLFLSAVGDSLDPAAAEALLQTVESGAVDPRLAKKKRSASRYALASRACYTVFASPLSLTTTFLFALPLSSLDIMIGHVVLPLVSWMDSVRAAKEALAEGATPDEVRRRVRVKVCPPSPSLPLPLASSLRPTDIESDMRPDHSECLLAMRRLR